MTAPVSQRDFAAALSTPLACGVPAGLTGNGRCRIERRFAVHRNNVVTSLVDALADAFPVTQALVGTPFFRAMARERVYADPPHSPVLIEYAETFPEYIARFDAAAGIACLADVARIEALRIRAYHAADARPITNAAYRTLVASPERLASTRFELHPACHWLRSRHAAYSIWQAHQGLSDPSAADLAGVDVDRPEEVLIHRPSLDVIVVALPEGSTAFLDALRDGEPLHAACRITRASCDRVDDGALLATLVRHGLVVALDTAMET